jgi:EF hand domain-containing protein
MFGLTRLEWLVLAGALLLCPGFSWGTETQATLFERLDRNKDGYLSAAELASDEAKSRNWIAVDRNRDGRISRAEFGLVGALPTATATSQPSAAAGASAPKKE